MATVCFDDTLTSKKDDAVCILILGTARNHTETQLKGQATTEVTNMRRKNNGTSAGLKSCAITDEPKRVLCPFQADCLVKLDYI